MFASLKRRIRDIKTIKFLCEEAQRLANADGQSEPGSEHFVMAALELPDGTAKGAFRRLNADPSLFHSAISSQYSEALRGIGIEWAQARSSIDQPISVPGSRGLYKAKPSAQALMQMLPELKKAGSDTPLLGAHVVLAAASAEYGVTPRALQSLGIERASLAEAATAEIAACDMAAVSS